MKTLDLYITKICNLNCEYCYVDLEDHENSFDLGKFSQRINLLDYDHIKFFGGEPLIKWKEIQQIIKMLEGKNKKFTIVTNGLLLNVEKVDFCLQNGIEIVISMHRKSVKQLLPKLKNFVFANKILGFSFVMEDVKISYAYKVVLYLQSLGFTNFLLTPEVYGDWNDENLQKLEIELSLFIKLFLKNPKIKFTGPDGNKLIRIIKGCTKNIVTKEGERKICNRFKSLKTAPKGVIVDLYKKFNEIIDYDNLPNKWFYVCPIGWYFDTQILGGDYEKRIVQYKNLNEVFVKFYKKMSFLQGKINFLSDNIDEIRFNLTSQCNLRCKYCYVDFKNDKLDFLEAKNIIDFLVLQPGNSKIISFFGGEPLLQFDLLKQIVDYAREKFSQKNKKISFKIATNFLLINEEKMKFFKENNFEFHISLNGDFDTNDAMRDNSTKKVLENVSRFFSDEEKKKIVILMAFSNGEILDLQKNLAFLVSEKFFTIHFEMIFGKKYYWKKEDFTVLAKEFLKIKKSHLMKNIQLYNNFSENTILDIDVNGNCSDNSLDFHHYDADFEKQKMFKKIVERIFIDK